MRRSGDPSSAYRLVKRFAVLDELAWAANDGAGWRALTLAEAAGEHDLLAHCACSS